MTDSVGKILGILLTLKETEHPMKTEKEVQSIIEKAYSVAKEKNIEENKKEKVKMAENRSDRPIQTMKELQNVEQECCNGRVYKESMITDPNFGHWDISKSPTAVDDGNGGKVNCWNRDPIKDIRPGVVGIDFGTKSTIVYFQDDRQQSLPVAIGDINNDSRRYENPTIIEFDDLQKFRIAYNKKSGRPDTKWKDLKISWTAKKNYDNCSDKEFSSYLDNLKQWASGKVKDLLIISKSGDGQPYKCKGYTELTDKDLDPIEVYAYLIGRSINNMLSGIHLEYYLSMPVKFSNEVREKLRKSFEKGLKKSLPTNILDDENIMKRFNVYSEITEPLAYAVTALEEYRIEPSEDEYYAVFDMGGGTLDYDFGKWEYSDDERYDYKIRSFGGDGMAQMGGENLLMDLATEVFRLNIENFKAEKKRIPFMLGPTSKRFEGCEMYVEDSVEARENMRVLINGEVNNKRKGLRAYWEDSNSLVDGNDDILEFNNLNFRCETPASTSSKVRMEVKKSQVENFFKEKIEEAVDNFFEALNSCEAENSGGDDLLGGEWRKVRIFLAGNSCKSPYVKELLKERIADSEGKYEIFPPLGEDAKKKMEELNIPLKEDGPTGKTGVAYGLIECRRGGKIQICKEDLKKEKFEFFIGKSKRKKFAMWTNLPSGRLTLPDPIAPWVKLQDVDCGSGVVEILYTNRPECKSGEMPVTDAKVVRCNYDAKTDAGFYVRATGTHSLEYAILQDENDLDYSPTVIELK